MVNLITSPQGNTIRDGNPSITLQTDAFDSGWVTVFDRKTELDIHINVMELQAVSLRLKALLPNHHAIHVQIQTDNTTAVSYINHKEEPIPLYAI